MKRRNVSDFLIRKRSKTQEQNPDFRFTHKGRVRILWTVISQLDRAEILLLWIQGSRDFSKVTDTCYQRAAPPFDIEIAHESVSSRQILRWLINSAKKNNQLEINWDFLMIRVKNYVVTITEARWHRDRNLFETGSVYDTRHHDRNTTEHELRLIMYFIQSKKSMIRSDLKVMIIQSQKTIDTFIFLNKCFRHSEKWRDPLEHDDTSDLMTEWSINFELTIYSFWINSSIRRFPFGIKTYHPTIFSQR